MAEALWITLILIVVAIGGILGFLYFVQITQTRKATQANNVFMALFPFLV